MTRRKPARSPAKEKTAIRVDRFGFAYPDGTPALRNVTMRIAAGEKVCLAGPNGAGKSTLLLCLAGLLRGRGLLLVGGKKPRAGRSLGLVFQDSDDQLFSSTVGEDAAFGPANQRLPAEETRRRVARALSDVGLSGFEERSAHHLSGGEKRRAAIAAVLACAPDILALDEPWAGLDARGTRAVTEILRDFPGTILVASQDLRHAVGVCHRMIVLDDGRIAAQGPMRRLIRNGALLDRHGLDHPFERPTP